MRGIAERGFFHLAIAEVRTGESKPFPFVAIDSTGRFAAAQLGDEAQMRTAWQFLEPLLQAVPYRIPPILIEFEAWEIDPVNRFL